MSHRIERPHVHITVTKASLWVLLIVIATAVAFWFSWVEIEEDVRYDSSIGFVFVLPVLAFFAAAGTALRRGGELPIHDRQTDIIVGIMGLGLSAAILGLLVPRYRYQYELLHLDLTAAWLFVLSSAILLFGLRPVSRFWATWLLVLLLLPPRNQLLMIAFGGTKVAAGLVMVLLAGLAAAIGSGRTRKRALAGAAVALLVGGIALAVMAYGFPEASILAYQAIPSILGVFSASFVMYVDWRRGSSLKPLDRKVKPLTAAQSRSAAVVVVVATIGLMVIPLPTQYAPNFTRMQGLVVDENPIVPPGWTLLGSQQYPWAHRYLGPSVTLTRQLIRADRGNPQWDKDSRRRRIVVDIVRSDNPNFIDRYPEFTLYLLSQPRITPPTMVDLGNGITGRINTVLDDRRLLSWTWLTWKWSGAGGAERISLIAADNHLPDAEFPQPQRSISANIENLMHEFLRGNAVVLDPNSDEVEADTDHKDHEMLTTVAQSIVQSAGKAS
ncbi:hypothetical protein AB0N05_16305 [Nocardia sp. NPDC051030]|uniref:hypothetical protein n=1 Tax=Nocardia sp. NPDC051030 TaxID=3155162 RepID=UPI0034486E8A